MRKQTLHSPALIPSPQGFILAIIEGMMIGINRLTSDAQKPVMSQMPSDPFGDQGRSKGKLVCCRIPVLRLISLVYYALWPLCFPESVAIILSYTKSIRRLMLGIECCA